VYYEYDKIINYILAKGGIMKRLIYKLGCVGVLLCFKMSYTSNLFIAIDLSYLLKSFGDIRRSLIQGVGSINLMGINHLIKEAVKKENIQRQNATGVKSRLLNESFFIKSQIVPHVPLFFIGKADQNLEELIHKIIIETIKEFKEIWPHNCFSLTIQPRAYFLNAQQNKTYVVQDVFMKRDEDKLAWLLAIIKTKFTKNSIDYSNLQLGPHVSFIRIDSSDSEVIDLIQKDESILSLLNAVQVPQGGTEINVNQIYLFRGFEKLHQYEL